MRNRSPWLVPVSKCTAVVVPLSVEFLGESDEKTFRPADVAEAIHAFILDNFAHELRAAFAEPGERLVDVVHGKHNAQAQERAS
jgi:hypothetical protein